MFRIQKKYVIRHAILAFLKSRIDKQPGEGKDLNLSHTSLHEIAKKLKVSDQEVYDHQYVMRQHHQIKSTLLGGKYYFVLEENGYAAYIDSFWLREGERELNERIYEKMKWLTPLVALLITSAALIISIYLLQQNIAKVQALKLELETLKSQQILNR